MPTKSISVLVIAGTVVNHRAECKERRLCSDSQAEEGESIAVQERTFAGYAQMHDPTVDRVFSERGVSGSKPLTARLQGAAHLAALQPGDGIKARF
jgi:hypothetical protein